jgi:hypothetical protein
MKFILIEAHKSVIILSVLISRDWTSTTTKAVKLEG